MDLVLRRGMTRLAAVAGGHTRSRSCENGLRLCCVSLGPAWALWQAKQSCSMSSCWNEVFRPCCGSAAPLLARAPESARARHSVQRRAVAPRNRAWQVKQSVVSSTISARGFVVGSHH